MGTSRRAVPLMLQLRPTRLGARSLCAIRFLSSVSDASSPLAVPTAAELAHPTEPVRLAILGSGLSGLSTAFYFLRGLSPSPAITAGLLSDGKVKVVIFEKSDRTGGWCQSLQVTGNDSIAGELPAAQGRGKGKLVFETGPRSIRPVALAGWLTVEMAHAIKLPHSDIITISKQSPSAKNRYVFYPNSLTLLPSSLVGALKALIFTPLLRQTLPGILTEPFRRRSRVHRQIEQSRLASSSVAATSVTPAEGNALLEDESVDSFFSRRFGTPLAGNMISAMIHGIYSGDTRRLSMRALFPSVWEAERESRSILLGLMFSGLKRKLGLLKESEYRLQTQRDDLEMEKIKSSMRETEEGKLLVERMEKASVWGVRGGLEMLTNQLRDYLVRQGVEFRMGDEGSVEKVKLEHRVWKIVTPASAYSPTHLVTTLPTLLPTSIAPPEIPSATVSVINLSFPAPTTSSDSASPLEPLFPSGFGYLIPRTVTPAMNPHNVLGVIFDSDVMPGVDDTTTLESATEELKQVKISILLGGSYWLPLPNSTPSPIPTPASLQAAAMETLALHFPTKKFPAPLHVHTSTHLNCIPQPPVGHSKLMREFGDRLRAAKNVGVVGGGTGAVGVNGAVRGAWDVGHSFARNVRTGEQVLTGVEMWK